MRIRLLPSNLAEPERLQPLTTFLINGVVAIDGGSLGIALGLGEQRLVQEVIVTHTHSDHVATLPIFIAEAFPFLRKPVIIHSSRESIAGLKEHIFNDKIWPDFMKIPLLNGKGPALEYNEIRPPVPFEVEGLRITPVWVSHTVPTTGLIVEEGDSAVVFTADTYRTDEIWHMANGLNNLKAIFVDVSYPNAMETLASDSKHLTPQTLALELRKLRSIPLVCAVHLKPQFREEVRSQLEALDRENITVGEIGRDYVF